MQYEPFELIPHTADVAVVVRGRGQAELLRHAAAALYHLASVIPPAVEDCSRAVAIESVDRDTLLIDWLNELIFHLYVENEMFSHFDFRRLDGRCVEAVCRGGRLRGASGPTREIKAATYHMAQLQQDNGGFVAHIVFDV